MSSINPLAGSGLDGNAVDLALSRELDEAIEQHSAWYREWYAAERAREQAAAAWPERPALDAPAMNAFAAAAHERELQWGGFDR
ncbi:hypothetical protein [Nocardia wallacei]|uniref:hypothetical protein n=1 Tax=Nocardia wallacei TaxID=480035 RepID=UPI0024563601|nr:hypothetical protein [Nocardia wallacei]